MPKEKENNPPLWAQLCKGDEKVFELFYAQYVDSLYQYGLKLTPQTQIIEDCIQDLFVGLFQNQNKLGKIQNVKYYLLKSFRNNLLKSIQKENRFLFNADNNDTFEVVFSIENKIIKTEEEQRKKKLLIAALKKLSARQKEAIYLRYTSGFDYDELAEIMKMSVETCRNTVYRAIKTLRKELKNTLIILFLVKKLS